MDEGPAVGSHLVELQEYIDARWKVAQPTFYPGGPNRLFIPSEVTSGEAKWFLAAARSWLAVDDERKMRSDRFPPKNDGSPLGPFFFEEQRNHKDLGQLRDEWIPHAAAAERLRRLRTSAPNTAR